MKYPDNTNTYAETNGWMDRQMGWWHLVDEQTMNQTDRFTDQHTHTHRGRRTTRETHWYPPPKTPPPEWCSWTEPLTWYTLVRWDGMGRMDQSANQGGRGITASVNNAFSSCPHNSLFHSQQAANFTSQRKQLIVVLKCLHRDKHKSHFYKSKCQDHQ